ncbi:MAG: transposase, partial [Phototrophicaceae bacterium]
MKPTQLLLINPKIAAGVAVKQALEQTGRFQVYPFADAVAALEFCETHVVDVAIVSMHTEDMPGVMLVRAVRASKPKALIIASTAESTLATQSISAGAGGLLEANYTAREVLNLIARLTGQNSGAKIPDATPPPVRENRELFEKLAADEPPPPTLEESGTVTDLMATTNNRDFRRILKAIESLEPKPQIETIALNPVGRDEAPALQDSVDAVSEETPAQTILEAVQDESVPLETLISEEYLEQLRRDREGDDSRYVREPDFLMDATFSDDPFEQPTVASAATQTDAMQTDAAEAETVTLYHVRPLPPVPQQWQEKSAPPRSPALPTLASDPEETSGMTTRNDLWVWEEDHDQETPVNPILVTLDGDDPRIAQMAITLTQASLESTAEATLLTFQDEIIAYDGSLSDNDLQEAMRLIQEDWGNTPDEEARLQYLTLSNGLDYMIYSSRTAGGFVLSMVFSGKTSLRDIRQQGNRMVTALQIVPEVLEYVAEPEDEVAEPASELPTDEQAAEWVNPAAAPIAEAAAAPIAEAVPLPIEMPVANAAATKPSKGGLVLEREPAIDLGTLVPYTFVWLLKDLTAVFDPATAEAINAGLRVQLSERGWYIRHLDVQDDYVYMVASIPGDEPAQSLIRNLQRRAAKIAATQQPKLDPETLWAESYFILSPGRLLNIQEVQQYINFYRM